MGLKISANSRIESPFSRQIAIGNAGPGSALDSMGPIGNAGPGSALDSMGPKPTFRCHFLNIGPSYKK